MVNGLTCNSAVILDEVESLRPELFDKHASELLGELHCLRGGIIGKLEEVVGMVLGKDEGMSLGCGAVVEYHVESFILIDGIGGDVAVCEFAENAIIFFHYE